MMTMISTKGKKYFSNCLKKAGDHVIWTKQYQILFQRSIDDSSVSVLHKELIGFEEVW